MEVYLGFRVADGVSRVTVWSERYSPLAMSDGTPWV